MKIKGPLFIFEDKIYKIISSPRVTRKGLWIHCQLYYIEGDRVRAGRDIDIPASSLSQMKKVSQLKVKEIV